MQITRLSPAGYARFPWKNGGGVTVDIAERRLSGSEPGSWEGLVWRLGRTTISQPGPFSDLAGFDRLQAVIAGSGLVLDTPEGEVDLRQPFRPARYRGEAPIASRLEAGPVEVVNLIADRNRVRIGLVALAPGEAAEALGEVVIHAPAGGARITLDGASHALEHDHALRFEAAVPVRVVAEEGRVLAASAQAI